MGWGKWGGMGEKRGQGNGAVQTLDGKDQVEKKGKGLHIVKCRKKIGSKPNRWSVKKNNGPEQGTEFGGDGRRVTDQRREGLQKMFVVLHWCIGVGNSMSSMMVVPEVGMKWKGVVRWPHSLGSLVWALSLVTKFTIKDDVTSSPKGVGCSLHCLQRSYKTQQRIGL